MTYTRDQLEAIRATQRYRKKRRRRLACQHRPSHVLDVRSRVGWDLLTRCQ